MKSFGFLCHSIKFILFLIHLYRSNRLAQNLFEFCARDKNSVPEPFKYVNNSVS